MKLSIIIPVYNVERYLEKCLDSCVNQTISNINYEIIIVNDGSTDSSLLIAKEYADKHNNVIIHNQINSGLSAARNKGIELSKGEYVWCVDSDDWIEYNSLENILPYLNGSDVICQAAYYRNINKDETIVKRKDDPCSHKELVFGDFDAKAQLYIYRKEFLIQHNLWFKIGIFHEDMQFTPRVLYLATNICITNLPLYHYLYRENSISTTIKPKRVLDLMSTYSDLVDFCKKHVILVDKLKWDKYVVRRIVMQILALDSKSNNMELHDIVKKFVNKNKKCTEMLLLSDNRNVRIIGCVSKILRYRLYFAYHLFMQFRKRK